MTTILKFKVGDKAKLRKDALVRHARSVPAHAGYTREQFSWRDTLKKYGNRVGVVTRVFPHGHVNLTFRDGKVIGIDQSELVRKRKTGA